MSTSSPVPEKRLGAAGFVGHGLRHASLIYAVIARLRDGRPALEVGAGRGARSAMISRLRERVVTVDDDRPTLRLARGNQARFGRGVLAVEGELARLPFATGAFAVAFSRGLFGRLDDETIGVLLRDQLRVADAVVFSVPSGACARSESDEGRIMDPNGWALTVRAVLGGAGYRVRGRGYRFDPQAWKWSLVERRWAGPCSILLTIDPVR